MNDVCLVIPVYNEEECISQVIKQWTNILSTNEINYKLVIINDGSTDNTLKILQKISNENSRIYLIDQTNAGHGPSVFKGYKKALELGSSWIFQVDSDDQFLAKDFIHFWKLRNRDTALQGVRRNRQDPFHRILLSTLVRTLIKISLNVSVRDANCPFRLYPSHLLNDFINVIPRDTFAPNLFISILAGKSKKLREISVHHKERQTGTVSIIRLNLIKACYKSFKQFITFRSNVKNFKLSKNHRYQDIKKAA